MLGIINRSGYLSEAGNFPLPLGCRQWRGFQNLHRVWHNISDLHRGESLCFCVMGMPITWKCS